MPQHAPTAEPVWDLIVVGGGTAGLPAAWFAAERGARVLLIDHAPVLGGTLWVANGQLSAAGCQLQRDKGIDDTPQAHFDDIMQLSRGTVNEALVRLAVWNAAASFEWLMDNGFDVDPACPVEGVGHEPYSRARYFWGREGGASLRAVLVPLVERAAAEGRLTLKMGHEVLSLTVDADGAVNGLTARGPDGVTMHLKAHNVALTCGGYTGDPEVYQRLTGVPLYTNLPYAFARGAGHRLGLSVGGYLRGIENYFINFGFLLDSEGPRPGMVGRLNTYPQARQPWEIYVNAHGNRFVREDMESVDARENALLEQPDYRYWAVFDQEIVENAPPFIAGFTPKTMQALFNEDRPFLYRSDTLEGLAEIAGIDAQGLASAVRGYNFGVHSGNDFLGRRHLPRQIARGPFYAVRAQGASVTSAVGLAVDETLKVIREDGSPIKGLFAAGEILGASQTMGRAVCGGMMATPALTFGRLLGQSLIPLDNAKGVAT